MSFGRPRHHPPTITKSEIKQVEVGNWILQREGALVKLLKSDVPMPRYVGTIGSEYKLLAEAILEIGIEMDEAWKAMYPDLSK